MLCFVEKIVSRSCYGLFRKDFQTQHLILFNFRSESAFCCFFYLQKALNAVFCITCVFFGIFYYQTYQIAGSSYLLQSVFRCYYSVTYLFSSVHQTEIVSKYSRSGWFKNFAKFGGKKVLESLFNKETPAEVFFCEFCDFFFTGNLQTIASEIQLMESA